MITLADVYKARERLEGVAIHTPLLPYLKAEGAWFKPESLQPIGSFKIRGAYNRIAALIEEQNEVVRASGVIAYSSGNHAQGVAYAAQKLGLSAVIVMPKNAPQVKIDATRSYGAEVVLYDPTTEKREEIAEQIIAQNPTAPRILVPPFNDEHVIAGQGTIGLEIFEDLPDVDLILTPVGGGGLISGVATAIKSLNPSIKVIGVEPEFAADARDSLRAGKIVEITATDAWRTIADGVRTLYIGDITFAHMQQYVDDIVTVSESEIKEALRRVVFEGKLVVEPSGVLPVAAYLFHQQELPKSNNTVMVLSGGSVEPAEFTELLRE